MAMLRGDFNATAHELGDFCLVSRVTDAQKDVLRQTNRPRPDPPKMVCVFADVSWIMQVASELTRDLRESLE